MAKKPETLHDAREVFYTEDHWTHLSQKREHAIEVMNTLSQNGMSSFVYGSVARGDVSERSDIDIIIPHPIASFRVELAVDRWVRRELVQATPSMVLKGHIYLDHDVTVTFPLFKLRTHELEFYKWGGQIDIEGLVEGKRVSGVDKRLVLIRPTKTGHIESGVMDHEAEVARVLGVSVDIAYERVRVLTRRDTIGRTGVYLMRVLNDDESFEEVAKALKDRDPALRRTIDRREG